MGFDFASRHPDLDLIYAHWGGGLPFYELMPDVRKALAKVRYDCSASPYLYSPDVYRVVLDAVGREKILFGSDFPLISPERYMEEMAGLGLADEDRSAIMGGNAAVLLGLRPDKPQSTTGDTLNSREILENLATGEISVEEAQSRLSLAGVSAIEGFARLDTERHARKGVPEVVYAPGKPLSSY